MLRLVLPKAIPQMRRAIDVDVDADASVRAAVGLFPLTTITTTITITTPTPHELLINLFFFPIGISGRCAHSAAFGGVLVLFLLLLSWSIRPGNFQFFVFSAPFFGSSNRAVLGA